MSDEELLDLIRFNRIPGLGPRLQTVLLNHFGSPGAVLRANGAALRELPRVGARLTEAITAARASTEAEEELERTRELGISFVIHGQDPYPELLAEICDPPRLLSCQGDLLPQDRLSIGIVGSRKCTTYGRQQAERLAGGLARAGFTIVSGLARGIDAAAHRGALRAGGRTIAVCATGLNRIYPPEHAGLAGEITQQGCLLTESPLDRGPTRGIFPQRNRIISGLSLGVIIVEAGRRSGALHTARHAQEQGREVFAVPGRIDQPECFGCLDLLRDGVTLVRTVDDVLEELGPLPSPVPTKAPLPATVLVPRELALSPQEREVLELVPLDATPLDEVLRSSPLATARVLATITVLEMKRLVRRSPGGFIQRVSH